MSKNIPRVYRPAELRDAIAALANIGFEERTAIDLVRKLHDQGFRILKVTP